VWVGWGKKDKVSEGLEGELIGDAD
jgi:hypothetical protein